MMRNAILIFSIPAFLFACKPGDAYQSHVQQLDRALLEVDSVNAVFHSLPLDSVGALYASIKDDMSAIQKKYRGEMPKDRAFTLSRYRDIPNNLKNFSEVRKAVEKEFELSASQLQSLREALVSGADVDGKGNKIDQTYVEKYSAEEIRLASALRQKVEQIQTGLQKSFQDYQQVYPELSAFLDSVKTLDEPVE